MDTRSNFADYLGKYTQGIGSKVQTAPPYCFGRKSQLLGGLFAAYGFQDKLFLAKIPCIY